MYKLTNAFILNPLELYFPSNTMEFMLEKSKGIIFIATAGTREERGGTAEMDATQRMMEQAEH